LCKKSKHSQTFLLAFYAPSKAHFEFSANAERETTIKVMEHFTESIKAQQTNFSSPVRFSERNELIKNILSNKIHSFIHLQSVRKQSRPKRAWMVLQLIDSLWAEKKWRINHWKGKGAVRSCTTTSIQTNKFGKCQFILMMGIKYQFSSSKWQNCAQWNL